MRVVAALAVLAVAVPAWAGQLPREPGLYAAGTAPLPMLDSDVAVHVRGPMVEATVTQTFRNDRDETTEATYIFPLPADAAVSAMAIDDGTRTIRASIARRADAHRRYEQAIAAGVSAALLDQERPDVFTQTVSAIPPHGTVKVTLRFDTTAQYGDGTWQLVLPMVVAPRYVPGTASGRPTTGTGRSPDTARAPDASRVTPGGAPGAGGATTVTLDFADAVERVTSPTHELRHVAGAQYAFVDPHSDHDAIVRWQAPATAAGWLEQDGDGAYAAVVVQAPRPAAHAALPARLLVVLDRAATTHGDAEAVERPLARALLRALPSAARVAIAGSDRIAECAPDQALHALDARWDATAGAFDLTRVLGGTRAAGAPVVVISDGLVADDRAAIAAARAVGAPIDVIGVGPAPNRSLLEAIARATGGTIRFALPGDDLAALARDVLVDAATPPAPLAVTWGTLAVLDVVPTTLPRVGAGQAALVVALVARVEPANARAAGNVFALATVAAPRPPDGATTPAGPIARRWSRLKLDELIAAGDRRAIEVHALRHGLVSPATSMIAIGQEVVVSGGVKHTIAVPVSVPAGMRWQEVERETTVAVGGEPRDNKAPQEHEARTQDHTRKHDQAKAENDARRQRQEPKPATMAQPEPTEQPGPTEPTEQAEAGAATGANEPSEAPRPSVATAEDADAGAQDEDVTITSTGPVARHRFALALGAGVALEHGSGAFAPSLTIGYDHDLAGRALAGVAATLWLVDGDAQGTLLATLTRGALPGRLELAGGLGVHAGGGIGPAVDLVLRVPLSLGRLGAFLRYDGALLFHDGTHDGQHAATLGIETHW